MFLSADIIDIASPLILLNIADASALGLSDGHRIFITNPNPGKSATIPPTVSETFVQYGTALLTSGANQFVGISSGDVVDILPAKRPSSLDFIRKKIDGGKLTRAETAVIVSDITKKVLSQAEVTSYITASYINGMDMDEV